MNSDDLKKWCAVKRGRASALAKSLETSRQFVSQMMEGTRPIPEDMVAKLRAAMRKADRKSQ